MSVPSADYDFLEPHFDLTSEFKPDPPPYLPRGYKFKPVRSHQPAPQLVIAHNRSLLTAHVPRASTR